MGQELAAVDGHRRLSRLGPDGGHVRHAARVHHDDGRVCRAHPDEISKVSPEAFEKRYKRGGQLSCWDDAALADGVAALGKKNIILAGLTTDICLYWAAYDAVRLGYTVKIIADACGTMSELGDEVTFASLRQMGVTVTVVNQIVTELVNNFRYAGGAEAQQIMSDEIISKLAA